MLQTGEILLDLLRGHSSPRSSNVYGFPYHHMVLVFSQEAIHPLGSRPVVWEPVSLLPWFLDLKIVAIL
jgi:hypothetical protein